MTEKHTGDPPGPWYHGSNLVLDTLRPGSTVTQWRELAEAFSHKPPVLCITDDGRILHTGQEYGYLYEVEGPIGVGREVYQHPRTTMEQGLEYLTTLPLGLRRIGESPGWSASESQEVMDRIRADAAAHNRE